MRRGQKRNRARALRATMTDAERALWRCLRMRQLGGFRFRRQHPVGPWILDFACLERGLVVEVDGGQHADAPRDVLRDAGLRRRGLQVLRVWNHEVLGNMNGVLELILSTLAPGPHPNPSRVEGWGGGEGQARTHNTPAPRRDIPAP